MTIHGKRIEIEFESEEDMRYFLEYWRRCKRESGTVSGLYAGLGCSALRRADIYDPETGESADGQPPKREPEEPYTPPPPKW